MVGGWNSRGGGDEVWVMWGLGDWDRGMEMELGVAMTVLGMVVQEGDETGDWRCR